LFLFLHAAALNAKKVVAKKSNPAFFGERWSLLLALVLALIFISTAL